MVVGSHELRSHKAANRQLQSRFLKLQELKSWRMNSSRCCFSVICFIPCLCGASQHMLRRMVRSQHLLSSSSMQPMQIAAGGVTVSDSMMEEKGLTATVGPAESDYSQQASVTVTAGERATAAPAHTKASAAEGKMQSAREKGFSVLSS